MSKHVHVYMCLCKYVYHVEYKNKNKDKHFTFEAIKTPSGSLISVSEGCTLRSELGQFRLDLLILLTFNN